MKRLAIFAEGLTETIFIQKLIEEIGTKHEMAFETRALVGTTFTIMQSPTVIPGQTNIYVLLVNCNNDERVKSVVLDQRKSLQQAGYHLIVGLRDLYPSALSDLLLIESRLSYGVPTKGIPTRLFLSVGEVEAWFVQEHTHFARIHVDFTNDYIRQLTGFDINTQTADSIEQPSKMLDQIYSSRGLRYAKKRRQLQRTVAAIDYAELYLCGAAKLPHLAKFISCIEGAVL